jgi:hypothetical protein
LLSAAPACADPTFLLTRPEARAGDTIGFSIAAVKKHMTYDIAVGGQEVLNGNGSAGGVITGQFTMPDLGAPSRTVTVQARIDARHGTTVALRTLQYLLPALSEPHVNPPPATGPAAAPAGLQQAAPTRAEPAHTVPAATLPAAPAPAGESSAPASKGAATEPRTAGRNRSPRQNVVVEKTPARHRATHRTKRRAARNAPLFDGLPESSSGGSGSPAQNDAPGLSPHATAPPTSVLTRARADRLTAAVIVPALLGLAAIALAGTALLRKRLSGRGTDARARPRARVP